MHIPPGVVLARPCDWLVMTCESGLKAVQGDAKKKLTVGRRSFS